jgi:hypothetical protein
MKSGFADWKLIHRGRIILGLLGNPPLARKPGPAHPASVPAREDTEPGPIEVMKSTSKILLWRFKAAAPRSKIAAHLA